MNTGSLCCGVTEAALRPYSVASECHFVYGLAIKFEYGKEVRRGPYKGMLPKFISRKLK